MRIAVIGGTGLAGRHIVRSLERARHEVVVVSRGTGVDVFTGQGLDAALQGVETVVDASSAQGDGPAITTFFATATRQLLAAEHRANVKHHVLLSIVGIERQPGNTHFAGKVVQEQLLAASPVPVTIQRATQFYEFIESLLAWTRQGDTATLPPLLLQPLAVADAAEVIADLAVGPPRGRVTDLAGPETQDLIDLVRRLLHARGESLRLVPSWRGSFAGVEAAGEAYLPGPEVRLTKTTFDTWLAAQSAR